MFNLRVLVTCSTNIRNEKYKAKIISFIFFFLFQIIASYKNFSFENYYQEIPLQNNAYSWDIIRLQKRELQVNISSEKNSTISTIEDATSITTLPSVSKSTDSMTSTSPGFDLDDGLVDEVDLSAYNTSIRPRVDHHMYYQSSSKIGKEEMLSYWVDFGTIPQDKVVIHDSLSNAHRRALTVKLSFDFPFYGHPLRNITIATGGFLFTGSYLHKFLAATQYIAPLMANFDTSVSQHSTVKYSDNGTSLTVEWGNVILQDNPDLGTFTFQVTIHQTGRIVFAYKDIPVLIKIIGEMDHPVKIGLSDAYILEKTVYYVRQKTIYEYHKIDIKKDLEISNWTSIVFEPLRLCLSLNTCQSCVATKTNFNCSWCGELGRCSDGLDRYRQEWIEKGCRESSVTEVASCALLPSTLSPTKQGQGESFPTGAASIDASAAKDRKRGSSSILIGFLFLLLLAVMIGGWITYAYFYPHTRSGQLLIKYRPSAWAWRRGEARYTAATMHSIHM